MDSKAVSSWARQSRYRAKLHGVLNDITIEQLTENLNDFEGKCAYCRKLAETFDHVFPIKNLAPNVQANILPICKKCKKNKKNVNIIDMYNSKLISEPVYISVIKYIFTKKHGTLVKEYFKKFTGHGK